MESKQKAKMLLGVVGFFMAMLGVIKIRFAPYNPDLTLQQREEQRKKWKYTSYAGIGLLAILLIWMILD